MHLAGGQAGRVAADMSFLTCHHASHPSHAVHHVIASVPAHEACRGRRVGWIIRGGEGRAGEEGTEGGNFPFSGIRRISTHCTEYFVLRTFRRSKCSSTSGRNPGTFHVDFHIHFLIMYQGPSPSLESRVQVPQSALLFSPSFLPLLMRTLLPAARGAVQS